MAASRHDIAVTVAEATKSFGERRVLDRFDLNIAQGEFVALLGVSGSGKTTLLKILTELERVDDGVVRVPRARSVVFQEPRLIPSMRVWRNVVVGQPRAQATRASAEWALEEVGLVSHANAWPLTLSGGEAQRVALARALVREPRLLLLGEPFASLDALTRLRMQSLVTELCERHNPAVLLVTHDVDEAILLADRTVVLKEGRKTLDLSVDLPKPRSRTNADFERIRRALLSELGVPSLESDHAEPRLSVAGAQETG